MSTNPGLPAVEPRTGLPRSVRVYEVAPRDGLQAEAAVIPTKVKVELILRLRAAGLRTIETTSFVSPRWIPQLADAREVTLALEPGPGVSYPVLVPNEKGLERALAAGAREIAVFASATETFARRNLNRDVDGVLRMFEPVVASATAHGIPVRGYVSMCFGDPWEGPVPVEDVVRVSLRLREMGCGTISIGDTIGVGTPGQVTRMVEALGGAGIPPSQVAMHFHDTYGQALANVYAALSTEIAEFDASAGGIGGCPYAGSATGNLATEDLVWLLTGLGIDHGVDLDALVSTSLWMAKHLGRPSPSRVVAALAQREQ
ncbi:hydroxymethylglutaryl-CoA lyase [Spiractinospora alimapuensis]|uniref:hydroxymethylglutaryl-CoA lyase n=1 Tax=Spiractinospora alimapuensis TaxID=2820884 RepID=UPI001F3152CE|nr:hydroxymethylglutaryl-CoA lyase [Spiractinospora alimapuensis]QVQ50406.1 hydroxymethylglutaryl-CoA lyase [Spiractinospora alimapuensis]